MIFTGKRQTLARNYSELGVKHAKITRNVQIKHVIVENLSERQLCTQLMNGTEPLRTYLLDLTSNALVVGQFGRKFALPSVRVTTFYDSPKTQNNDAWRALTKNEKEFLISIQSVPAILANSVTDIARKFSYTKIIVIYDRNFGE